MTNLEIQTMLERAYNSSFLDSIEFLSKREKQYKKSDFYKQTKIPLFTLYEKYFAYHTAKLELVDQLNEVFVNFDTEYAVEKIEQFIDELGGSEKIQELLNDLLENFDPKQLEKYAKEFDKKVEPFRNK